MVSVVWGFEPFSHENHHIRVYMHHVCLIQSISARKATHIKLGTRSGSSQCQLHFGTKIVSIGCRGCEWLPSECKNEHFQAFPPLAPSAFVQFFCLTTCWLLYWNRCRSEQISTDLQQPPSASSQFHGSRLRLDRDWWPGSLSVPASFGLSAPRPWSLCVSMCVRAYVCVCVCVCMYVFKCVRACLRACMCEWVSEWVCVCVCVCACVCECVCVWVCGCVWVGGWVSVCACCWVCRIRERNYCHDEKIRGSVCVCVAYMQCLNLTQSLTPVTYT